MNLVFHKISSKSFFLAKLLRLFFKSVYFMKVNNINDHENRILEKKLIKSGLTNAEKTKRSSNLVTQVKSIDFTKFP